MKIRIFSTLIIGCMLVLSAAVSGGCSDGNNEAKQLFVSHIRRCNRLNLGEMRISKTATIEDLKLSDADGPRQTVAALLDAVKIGDRKAVYSYDTYLTAFIDLSAFRKKTLTLTPMQSVFASRSPLCRPACRGVTLQCGKIITVSQGCARRYRRLNGLP